MAENKISKFLEDLEEKVLECSICLKRLQQPKSLSCLHSFCMSCLCDWVKKNGELICPTCSKSYPIPDGGLEKLPPSTFVNNLLQTIEEMEERDKCECNCEIGKKATYYCQECRQYICSTCYDHHKKFRALKNHILHQIEDLRSMTPLEFSSLHRQQCSLHNEPLKFYCKYCKTVICMHCAITDHNAADGSHKAINISEAFNEFKQTANEIEEACNYFTTTVESGITKMLLNATKLDQNKDTSLRDIDNHVKEMYQIIKDKEQELKIKVVREHEKRKNKIDAQVHELRLTVSDVKRKLNFLCQLLKSDEAIALQSSEAIITGLKDRIKELPSKINKGATENNQEIHFFQNKHQITELKKHGIGNVSEKKIADYLKVNCSKHICVTQYQTITVKLAKMETCEIHASQLNAKLTVESTGETNMTTVQEDDDGNYIVKGACTNIGVYKLDISINCVPVKNSPVMIHVEKEGLVNTIKVGKKVTDIVWCNQENCLLAAYWKNDIYKYKQTGEYIGKITLQEGVRVNRMYKMMNGNLAFSDDGNDKCIKICTMDGQVKKTIGKGCLNAPSGVKVNEPLTEVYATGFYNNGAFRFDIDSNVINRTSVKQGGYNDVTFAEDGKLLLLNYIHNKLELYDKDQFRKVLVWPGDDSGKIMEPGGVVVDDDGNIIISSKNKLQLFNSDGSFIKRIDRYEDGINFPWGLTIISHHPRRVALTNHDDTSIKIFNY
ncbi:tripartite motif-containing protein 2-like [Anneissia japonica]|uniref:tripartite motif-containing protein 2-like n=1 Tax=Anneissia japonica TaxID=1529436 RepID=UPI0014256E37|nr:tripartite motif-containing protein 2-like [Anneissia japonica]